MKIKWKSEYFVILVAGLVGAVGGFCYWKFVGCSSGTCPITSSPILSSIWGFVLGVLLYQLFRKRKMGNGEKNL